MKHRSSASGLLRVYLIPMVLGMVSGCSSGPTPGDPSWTLTPISDIRSVAGEWDGTMRNEQALLLPGTVHLMIRENGTYLFVGQDAVKSAVGSGFLDLRDGRLVGETDRRAVTLTLYDHKGTRILHADSINHQTGDRYHGEFKKAE